MNENAEDKWLVIVNPNAGKKKGCKDWPVISSILNKYMLRFEAVFTGGRHHAIEIAREYVQKGYRKFIAVGGDGTMNEVINGIFKQDCVPSTEVTVGMITVGTGNDWGRMFNIPRNYEGAVRTLVKGNTFLQDAGKVVYMKEGSQENRYFVNIAGVGFDAFVVGRTNRLKDKGKSGPLIYLMNILTSLFRYRHSYALIDVDGEQFKDKVFSISIGIGRYCGGGMMQTPHAVPDDGLFDVTLIRKMSKGRIISSLGKLYNGKIVNHPRVITYRGKNIFIDSQPLVHVEADGESLGHSPFTLEVVPSAVNVIMGE